MAKSVIDWNEDNVAILKAGYADALSCSAIAAKLGPGVTRNAVIGKLHRMNLCRHTIPKARGIPHVRKTAPSAPTLILRTPEMIEAYKKQVSGMKAARKRQASPVIVQIPAPLALESTVTLLKLNSGMCKYIIGPDSYCGHAQKPGNCSPYCPHHHQITHDIPSRVINIDASSVIR